MIIFINDITKITNYPNFKFEQPVNVENYISLVAEYQLTEDVKCCFLNATGNLCKQSHRHGFLVKTKTGVLTIVGNDCARERFGAAAKIVRDVIAFDKEKEFQRKYETLSNFLVRESEITESFNGYTKKILEIIQYNNSFKGKLGSSNHRQLMLMEKARDYNIYVMLGFIKRGSKNDDNEVQQTSLKLGSLQGLSSYNSEVLLSIIQELSVTINAFGLANTLKLKFQDDGVKPSTDRLNAVIQRSNFIPSLESHVKELIAEHERFKLNDPKLFCYLVRASKERAKAAHYLSSITGYLKGQPYVLINEMDNMIKIEHKADFLSI